MRFQVNCLRLLPFFQGEKVDRFTLIFTAQAIKSEICIKSRFCEQGCKGLILEIFSGLKYPIWLLYSSQFGLQVQKLKRKWADILYFFIPFYEIWGTNSCTHTGLSSLKLNCWKIKYWFWGHARVRIWVQNPCVKLKIDGQFKSSSQMLGWEAESL